jgi:hypothetical protein
MRNNVNSIWTEEVTATLKRLWSEGYSCSQIAAEMGIGLTRNAVIGKVHRLGLEKRYWGNGYSRQISPIPADTPRKYVPRPPRRQTEKSPPKIIFAASVRTGASINLKQPRLRRQLTKTELRAMLTLAVQNTAAMQSELAYPLQGMET